MTQPDQDTPHPDPADGRASEHHHRATGQVEHALSDLADATQHAVEAVNKRAGRDLLAATGVALGLLGLAGVCLMWFPWGLAVIVTAAVLGAQLEIGRVLRRRRDLTIAYLPMMAGSAALGLGTFAARTHGFVSPALWMAFTVGLTVVAILVWRLTRPAPGYVADVCASLFLLVYPCLLIVSVLYLLAGPRGAVLMATFIVGVAATDTGGYLVGMVLGRHQFAPKISPKKSWEGVAGSFVFAIGLVTPMVVFALGQPWWKGAVLAVVVAVSAIVGDLVESVIKRDLGIKDMGDLLPGHGGIMDRVDSYVLAAFPAWLAMTWLFPDA